MEGKASDGLSAALVIEVGCVGDSGGGGREVGIGCLVEEEEVGGDEGPVGRGEEGLGGREVKDDLVVLGGIGVAHGGSDVGEGVGSSGDGKGAGEGREGIGVG